MRRLEMISDENANVIELIQNRSQQWNELLEPYNEVNKLFYYLILLMILLKLFSKILICF